MHDKQLSALAFSTLKLLQKRWFSEALGDAADQHMVILLLAVYSLFKARDPLHKKLAWNSIGVKDIKTGRKYVSQAEKLGLISVVQSPIDRRKELLYPTPRLEKLISEEFEASVASLRDLVTAFQNFERASADHRRTDSAA